MRNGGQLFGAKENPEIFINPQRLRVEMAEADHGPNDSHEDHRQPPGFLRLQEPPYDSEARRNASKAPGFIAYLVEDHITSIPEDMQPQGDNAGQPVIANCLAPHRCNGLPSNVHHELQCGRVWQSPTPRPRTRSPCGPSRRRPSIRYGPRDSPAHSTGIPPSRRWRLWGVRAGRTRAHRSA